MNKPSSFFRGLAVTALFALCACGSDSRDPIQPGNPEGPKPTQLTAGNSVELVGSWNSPCYDTINSESARTTYIFQPNGMLHVLRQTFSDDACQVVTNTEHITGRTAYGNAVTSPPDAKAIDFAIDGHDVVHTIYRRQGDDLCFGSFTSRTSGAEGRPAEISCVTIYRRI